MSFSLATEQAKAIRRGRRSKGKRRESIEECQYDEKGEGF
jgi:hypothetical protein